MIRLVTSAPAEDARDADDSVTLAEAARRLGCAPSTVRELLELGELTGHRVGKSLKPRGIRVHLASIRRYRERHALGRPPRAANDEPTPARKVTHNPRAAEARRRLRELGVL